MALMDDLLAGRCSPNEAAATLISKAALREVGIDTNMICNLKCRYCYLDDRADAKGSAPLDSLAGHLSRLARAQTRLFAFIGKEPLSDGRAVMLVNALQAERRTNRDIRTGMVTNGTLVERWVDQLVDADLSYLDISIDGITDEANRLRGKGVTARILAGVDAVLASPLRPRFATATVLTDASLPGYPEFAARMFDRGVPTCFASPVLRFAMSNEVADIAVALEETLRLADRLGEVGQRANPGTQVIIDLPYRYSWALLASGRIRAHEILEDRYEAIHCRWAGSNVYLKINPFSFSYWRALRVTHDGRVIINMDLAAHADYAASALDLEALEPPILASLGDTAQRFLADFIARHVVLDQTPIFERGLAGQYVRQKAVALAA